jgi:hypothetical protein
MSQVPEDLLAPFPQFQMRQITQMGWRIDDMMPTVISSSWLSIS